MNWRSLSDDRELQEIIQDSHSQPQAIFKHSIRCGISAMMKKRLENKWEKCNPNLPIYLLDLVNNRDLSNKVADELSVRHESPQLIVLENGQVSYHNSHIGISSTAVAKHIRK